MRIKRTSTYIIVGATTIARLLNAKCHETKDTANPEQSRKPPKHLEEKLDNLRCLFGRRDVIRSIPCQNLKCLSFGQTLYIYIYIQIHTHTHTQNHHFLSLHHFVVTSTSNTLSVSISACTPEEDLEKNRYIFLCHNHTERSRPLWHTRMHSVYAGKTYEVICSTTCYHTTESGIASLTSHV